MDPDGHGAHAGEHLRQLRLPVAGDAGHAEDLAGVHLQRDVVQGRPPVSAQRRDLADPEARLAAAPDGLLLADAEGRSADHHAGQLALVRGARSGAHHAPAPHDADAIADGPHLAQLVTDEDDGETLAHEAPQGLEERFDLVGHEHGRGLVEDEDAAVACQGLDDLDALLLAHGEPLHHGIGPHGDAEALRGSLHALACGRQVQPGAPSAPQDDVLRDRHGLHEREVLGDHAHAGRDGVAGRPDADGLPTDVDGAAVHAGQPVEDAHQRRLAGPVLAQQGVDLTPRQGEVHAVVRDKAAEALGDASQIGGQVALAAVADHGEGERAAIRPAGCPSRAGSLR